MSGHSKWSQIKRQKGAKDVKRSGIFSKLSKAISIAARSGPNPKDNFKLRLAIEKAREANMPNDNIERAIKKGSGEDTTTQIEEITYEGYGPGGMALIIQAITDNKNRTVADVRHLLQSHGGSIGNAGSVAWQFASKGVVRVAAEHLTGVDRDELELQLIDIGAEDIRDETEGLTIFSDAPHLETIKTFLEGKQLAVASSAVELVPTTAIELNEADHARAMKLIEALEEHDDISGVYSNANA